MTVSRSEEESPGCAECAHLTIRGETIVRPGSLSEATPFLESIGPDVEPVLRFYCAHEPSVRAGEGAGAPIRREFGVDTIDGVDHATGSWDVAMIAEHPGAVSAGEVPAPARPRWCRIAG